MCTSQMPGPDAWSRCPDVIFGDLASGQSTLAIWMPGPDLRKSLSRNAFFSVQAVRPASAHQLPVPPWNAPIHKVIRRHDMPTRKRPGLGRASGLDTRLVHTELESHNAHHILCTSSHSSFTGFNDDGHDKFSKSHLTSGGEPGFAKKGEEGRNMASAGVCFGEKNWPVRLSPGLGYEFTK